MTRDLGLELARAVKARREALGLSPELLAVETDGKVGATTIREIERGKPPRLGTIAVLAEVFGVKVGELLGEEPSAAGRLGHLEAFSDDLTDSDIATLTIVARQLASARRGGLRPEDIPIWGELSPKHQEILARLMTLPADPTAARTEESDGDAPAPRQTGRRPRRRAAGP